MLIKDSNYTFYRNTGSRIVDEPHHSPGARDLDLLLMKARKHLLVTLGLGYHKIFDTHPGFDRQGDA